MQSSVLIFCANILFLCKIYLLLFTCYVIHFMMYCSFNIFICFNIEERCTVEDYYSVQIKVLRYNDLTLSLRTSPVDAQPHNIFLCASCHPCDRSPTVTPTVSVRFVAKGLIILKIVPIQPPISNI